VKEIIASAIRAYEEIVCLRFNLAHKERVYKNILEEMTPQERSYYVIALDDVLGSIPTIPSTNNSKE
jgi:hypothetical protein